MKARRETPEVGVLRKLREEIGLTGKTMPAKHERPSTARSASLARSVSYSATRRASDSGDPASGPHPDSCGMSAAG